jgi:Bifunctional DNA primase/polymerase, N-terminal/Primase C terminal 2 (PriCT-2)/AAA domain
MSDVLKFSLVSDPAGPERDGDATAPAAGTGDNALLRAALTYAARGWRVHPLRPKDKVPLLRGWPEQATTEPNTIRAWWASTPSANVGLVPGPKSASLAVVDIDPRNGGLKTWERLRQRLPLGPTLVVRTGSGGFHCYYDAAALFATSTRLPTTLGPGIDVHAHDTLNIVAPPSIHPNGRAYVFLEHATPAPYPSEWLTAIDVPSPETPKFTGTGDVLKARLALSRLDPMRAHEYETWLEVGMALKSVADELVTDWDQWSRASTKYEQGRCEAKWSTFGARGDGLTLASLVAWAKTDEEARGFIAAASVTVTQVEWLWYGRVAFGKLQGLIGLPDQGKDTVALDLAARLSRGAAMPDGRPSTRSDPRPTYYLSVEDAVADTLKPRFLAAGGDERYLFSRHAVTVDDDLDVIRRDLARAQRANDSGPGLMVLSPFDAFLSGKVDAWKAADIRRTLAPLALLIEESGWALVAIAHLTKDPNRALIHRIANSQAVAAALRIAYIVGIDPTDPTGRRRLFLPVKRNLLPPDVIGLAFHLQGVPTPGVPTSAQQTVPRAVWDGESRMSGAELFLTPAETTKTDRAQAWLYEQFTGGGSESPDGVRIPARDLQARAERDGHAWNTVRQQLREIGAVCEQARDGRGKLIGSEWRLPTATY